LILLQRFFEEQAMNSPATTAGTEKIRHLAWDEIKTEAMSPLITRRYISAERMTVARFELKKGCYIAEHHHENEQITQVLQGTLKLRLAGVEYVVRAGELLVIPPHVPHDAEALEDTLVLDVFSPPRADWASNDDGYLRANAQKR
jgi:quercetin dioxygenase-like cupin family protein